MELSEYSTEELQAELHRRKKEARKKTLAAKKNIERYAYVKAEIVYVSPHPYTKRTWEAKILDDWVGKNWTKRREFCLLRNNFSKDTSPRLGDIVKIKSLKTKMDPTGFGLFSRPYIIEVIARAEQSTI